MTRALSVADASPNATGRLDERDVLADAGDPGTGPQRGQPEHRVRSGRRKRQPDDAAHLRRTDQRRSGDDRAPAGDPGQRGPPDRPIQQDVDVHAVHHDAVMRDLGPRGSKLRGRLRHLPWIAIAAAAVAIPALAQGAPERAPGTIRVVDFEFENPATDDRHRHDQRGRDGHVHLRERQQLPQRRVRVGAADLVHAGGRLAGVRRRSRPTRPAPRGRARAGSTRPGRTRSSAVSTPS